MRHLPREREEDCSEVDSVPPRYKCVNLGSRKRRSREDIETQDIKTGKFSRKHENINASIDQKKGAGKGCPRPSPRRLERRGALLSTRLARPVRHPTPSDIQGRAIRQPHLHGVKVGHASSQLPNETLAILVLQRPTVSFEKFAESSILRILQGVCGGVGLELGPGSGKRRFDRLQEDV